MDEPDWSWKRSDLALLTLNSLGTAVMSMLRIATAGGLPRQLSQLEHLRVVVDHHFS